MVKFSIIINTHNQDEFILDAINSCLKQTYKNFEILIFNTSRNKINYKTSFQERKKIKFFHQKSKYKQPELNQMFKIYQGFKKSKGNYLLLLDGDDKFDRNKLNRLNKILKKKEIYCNQDLPFIFSKNFKKTLPIKTFKYNSFIKIFLNDWPQIYGTSSIIVKKEVLQKFFEMTNPFAWKMLAIDAQIILFSNIFSKQTNYLSGITFKRLHDNNLGDSYLNFFKKKFWARRYMQFQYVNSLEKKQTSSFDFYITKIIYFFFKNL